MGLISQSIKNLKGGVSQQPDILRFQDQGQSQINGFSSEVEGLQKRPPSKHLARFGDNGSLGVKPLVHLINRDEFEKYYCVFTGSDIKIYDLLNHKEVSVNKPQGIDYIVTSNPRNDLRMVTVADYTFIINRNVTTAVGGLKTPSYNINNEALVVVKGGQYGKTFKIILNGVICAEYTTPIDDNVDQSKQIDIQYIIDQLVSSYNNNGSRPSGSTAYSNSGYVHIVSPSTTLNNIKVEDGYNGQLMKGIIHTAQRTTDLPVYAPNGYMVNISGDATTTNDDYWVKFVSDENIWKECAAPNIPADFMNHLMPWILVRDADGTFTIKQAVWTSRECGDEDTNPYPSFLDNTINDIFFFRNRLGFLSGENVILSNSGEYFNFFPNSVAVTSDSDPIDVAVSTNRISILKYAVPFSEELLLWSDQSQFVLSADGILSPTSVRLDLTTDFEVSDKARPYGIGRGVYFVSPRAKFSSIRRFYAVQDVTQVKNAEDISAHVPSYIPNGVYRISGSSTENFITVLTEGDENNIYVYKFLYLQEQLVQQSWSFWSFGDSKVLSCEMVNSVMYLLIDAASGIYLEAIEFTQNTADFVDEPYRLYIDRKIPYTVPAGSYDIDTNITSIHLKNIYGATPATGSYYFVRPFTDDDSDPTGGVSYRFDAPLGGWIPTDGLIELDGNWDNKKFYVGEVYMFTYEFSKFLIKQNDAQGGVSTEDIGRLQLRRAWVNYDKSGNFVVTVNNQGREFSYSMTGNRLSDRDTILGDVALDTGQFKYPISGNAKIVSVTVTSDTPNAVSLIGGGWEGMYMRRSSGV